MPTTRSERSRQRSRSHAIQFITDLPTPIGPQGRGTVREIVRAGGPGQGRDEIYVPAGRIDPAAKGYEREGP